MLRKHRSLGHDKEMLRNLDILAYEQYTLQQLKQLPSVQKVIIEVENTYPRNSLQNQYPLCCQISEFKQYGPGVYLVFRFIKYMLIVMGILLPLPTINLIVLVVSQDHFINKNMQTTLQTTTISNMTDSNSTLVIALNFVVLAVLTISILYWRYIQTDEVLSCTKKTSLSSYYTVILSTIPNYYSEHDLVQHLQKNYGKVHSIYTVKNYEKDLVNYQEMEHIIEQFKEEREVFLRKKAKDSCLNLVQLFFSYKQKHQALLEDVVHHTNYEPILVFVTFQNVSARNKLLSDLQVKFNCFGKKTNKQEELENQLLYKDQRLQFRSCQMQPNGIIWENINVPIKEKLLRISLIVCLLAAFLFFSVTVFFVLAAAHSSLYSDQFQHYTQEELLQLNNPNAIKSYCIDLSYSLFRQKNFCSPYLKDYVNYFILYLAFPLFVTFLKGIFILLMKKLVVIRRHKYQFYKIKWEITIITLFYFLKAGLIKWIIYRSFSVVNFHFQLIDIFMPLLNSMTHLFPIRPDLIPNYEDFNKQWVAHASHSTILIAIISFNFSILLSYFTNIIVKKYKSKAAESQDTHKKMKQMLKGQQFQFQFIYSQFLALFLFSMLYFSCSPIIYLLVYISILLLYWVSKHKLLRLSQIPPVYAHTIHEMAVKIIMIGLMMNSLVSPLYYANLDESNHSSWPQRWSTYWYYTLNFFVLLLCSTCNLQIIKLYIFLKNKVVNFFENTQNQYIYEKKISSMAPVSNYLQSYSMHSSQKYKQVLKILFALNRNQVQHLGVFTQKDIQEIKNSIGQSQNQFKIFQELQYFFAQYIKMVEKDPQRSAEYIANKQKFVNFKKQLQKIREQVDKEIKEQQKLIQLHNMVNSKLVYLKKSKLQVNMFEEAERKAASKQNSAKVPDQIVDQMEQCMDTDVRIV